MRTHRISIPLLVSLILCIALFGCGNPTGGGGGGGGTTVYTLTLTSSTEVPTTEVYGFAMTIPAGHNFTRGSTVELIAIASSDSYMFSSWEGSATGETSPQWITMDASKNILARFMIKPSVKYDLTLNRSPDAGAGMVDVSGTSPYDAGTMVTLTAEANIGYKFDHWAVNGMIQGSSDPTTLLMNSTKEVTAVFISGEGTSSNIVYVSTTGDDLNNDGSVSHPFQHIQKGLDIVHANGTVSVDAGTYTENLVWPNTKNVTLRGASMNTTTLDANNAGRGIDIEIPLGGPDIGSARIEKMTIMKGKTTELSGGGICFLYTGTSLYLYEVNVHDCSVEGSTGSSQALGGGIYAKDTTNTVTATLEMVRCIIKNNTAITPFDGYGRGGGIYARYITLKMSNCEVSYNLSSDSAGGIYINSAPEIFENNIIHHNKAMNYDGGGICSFSTAGSSIYDCTITSNEAPGGQGGGLYTYGGTENIQNCIIWGNTAEAGNAIAYSTQPTVQHSDIQGGFTGTSNIDEDPVFESVDDLHLTSGTSTDVSEGGVGGPIVDYDGNARTLPYSMGAYEKN